MALIDFAPEFGTVFTLNRPSAGGALVAIAQFNNPSSPFNVGVLSNLTGLDSPEIRENGEELVEFDGGIAGPGYAGRRPIVLEGLIYGHDSVEERSAKIALLRNASNALRDDAYLTWTPSVDGAVPVFLKLRRHQPLRIEGGWNKTFQCAMIASDPHIYSSNSESAFTAVASSPITLENKGDATTYPKYTILGPMTQPIQITNNFTGAVIRLDTSLTFNQGLLVDTLARTVFTVDRLPGSRRNLFPYPSFEDGTNQGFASPLNMTLSIVAQPGVSSGRGTKVLKLTRTAPTTENTLAMTRADAATSLTTGDKITVGFDHLAAATPSNGTPRVTFTWKNSGGTTTGTFVVTGTSPADGSTSSAWKRFIAVSDACPSGSTRVDVQIAFLPVHTNSNPNYWVDGVTIERSLSTETLPDGQYFDGANPRPGNLAAWEGTADASISQSYTTEYNPLGAYVPSYASVNFATTVWSGLKPGDNAIQCSFGAAGVGPSFRADWNHAWL